MSFWPTLTPEFDPFLVDSLDSRLITGTALTLGMFDKVEGYLERNPANLIGHMKELSKGITSFKVQTMDESGSGGNCHVTKVKLKDGVKRTEGRGYQRGLRDDTQYWQPGAAGKGYGICVAGSG